MHSPRILTNDFDNDAVFEEYGIYLMFISLRIVMALTVANEIQCAPGLCCISLHKVTMRQRNVNRITNSLNITM